KVDSGWERAAETVLGQHLQAVCVSAIDSLAANLQDFGQGQLSLLDSVLPPAPGAANTALAERALKARVRSAQPLDALLDGVYCAEDLAEALRLRGQLVGSESLIAREGLWLGRHWLRAALGFDEKAGMIQRQEEIERLGEDIHEQEATVAEAADGLEQAQQRLHELEREKEELRQQLAGIGRQLSELGAERSAKLMKIQQVSERRKRLQQELTELERQLAVEKDNLAASRGALQTALDGMAEDTERREELLRSRDEYRAQLDQTRQKGRHDR